MRYVQLHGCSAMYALWSSEGKHLKSSVESTHIHAHTHTPMTGRKGYGPITMPNPDIKRLRTMYAFKTSSVGDESLPVITW